MSLLKIGIIGGGGITGAHLPRLSQHPEVELVALADLNPAAKATAEQWGIPNFFSDYHDLLPLVDAVLICVPTFLHADIAVAALEAGKAVFCEKPLARTPEQAAAIEAAVAKSDAPFQVGFVRRFDEEWLGWQESIQQEKIGRPVIWHDVASSTGPAAPWFYRDEQGGGPFLDGCIHNIDFALATFGKAEWAFCNGRTMRTDDFATAIDTGTATVRFESGDELLLAWTWALPANVPAARVFEVLGPQGSLTWPAFAGIDPSATPGGEQEVAKGHFLIHRGTEQEEVEFPLDALTQAFAAQMDEFVQVARGEIKPRAGVEEGRESLRLALAILESARSGEVVRL